MVEEPFDVENVKDVVSVDATWDELTASFAVADDNTTKSAVWVKENRCSETRGTTG